jgi:hypothetical protein
MQAEGIFDIPPRKRCEQEWRVQIALDRPWNVGLIVKPKIFAAPI